MLIEKFESYSTNIHFRFYSWEKERKRLHRKKYISSCTELERWCFLFLLEWGVLSEMHSMKYYLDYPACVLSVASVSHLTGSEICRGPLTKITLLKTSISDHACLNCSSPIYYHISPSLSLKISFEFIPGQPNSWRTSLFSSPLAIIRWIPWKLCPKLAIACPRRFQCFWPHAWPPRFPGRTSATCHLSTGWPDLISSHTSLPTGHSWYMY